MLGLKQHAQALRDRCARHFGTGHGIIVGEVGKRYTRGTDYTFDIEGYDAFDFRGRPRREVVWTARVHVTPQHEVVIEESGDCAGSVPAEALQCALDALSAADYHVVSR